MVQIYDSKYIGKVESSMLLRSSVFIREPAKFFTHKKVVSSLKIRVRDIQPKYGRLGLNEMKLVCSTVNLDTTNF